MLKNKILVFFFLSILFPNLLYAQEKNDKLNIQDQFVVSSLKTLVKTYLACTKLDKVKTDVAANIGKMSDKKLTYNYDQFYSLIGELKSRFGFIEDMKREEIVKNINSLDSEKINKLIDSVPDRKIVAMFKEYSVKNEGKSLSEKIQIIWSKVQKQLFGQQ